MTCPSNHYFCVISYYMWKYLVWTCSRCNPTFWNSPSAVRRHCLAPGPFFPGFFQLFFLGTQNDDILRLICTYLYQMVAVDGANESHGTWFVISHLYCRCISVYRRDPPSLARRRPHQEGNDGRPPAQLRRKKMKSLI